MRKMITNKIGNYVPAEWDGINRSGIRILGEEVLILPDEVPTKTKGGILLAETTKETHSYAAQTGVVVTMGADAWSWNRSRTRQYTGVHPEPGDRVIFDRYGGKEIYGLDGRMYFIMSDMVIGGMFEANEAEGETNAA